MKSSKAEEIAELQAMLSELPDDDDTVAIDKYEKDPEDIHEIHYRRKVKNRHFNSLKVQLTCEGCGVTYYEHLPGRYDGRLCGENCATIELGNARELLDSARDFAPAQWIRELEGNETLRRLTPEHLVSGAPSDMTAARIAYLDRDDSPAPQEPAKPLTLAEKIAAKLK